MKTLTITLPDEVSSESDILAESPDIVSMQTLIRFANTYAAYCMELRKVVGDAAFAVYAEMMHVTIQHGARHIWEQILIDEGNHPSESKIQAEDSETAGAADLDRVLPPA